MYLNQIFNYNELWMSGLQYLDWYVRKFSDLFYNNNFTFYEIKIKLSQKSMKYFLKI